MKEALEKAFYTGLGVLSLGKDAVEKSVKKIAKELKLSEDEGKKFAKNVGEETIKARENLTAQIEKIITGVMEKLNVATHKDLKTLESRLAALEKKLRTTAKADEAK